jgi:hypothetical protein
MFGTPIGPECYMFEWNGSGNPLDLMGLGCGAPPISTSSWWAASPPVVQKGLMVLFLPPVIILPLMHLYMLYMSSGLC